MLNQRILTKPIWKQPSHLSNLCAVSVLSAESLGGATDTSNSVSSSLMAGLGAAGAEAEVSD